MEGCNPSADSVAGMAGTATPAPATWHLALERTDTSCEL